MGAVATKHYDDNDDKKKLHIDIEYCRAWGMPKHFRSLRNHLMNEFPNTIKVTGSRDKRVTGNFIVTVQPEGRVLHQRTTRIGGVGKTEEERRAIVQQIHEILLEKQ